MNNELYLGFDTSNYTTSAAVFGKTVEVNCKKLLPVSHGGVGLRQSDAVFHHTRQLPDVFEQAVEAIKACGNSYSDIKAIGVSNRPRAVSDSYMPCFLVGELLARSLALANDLPLYQFSHQQGHIAAALYSSGRLDLLQQKFIAFHISGGTTEGLLVTRGSDGTPDARLICSSTDLKAGQAIDRIGVALGLDFPAGKQMDELAQKCDRHFDIKPSVHGASFSLSGVQNKCEKMISDGLSPEEVSRFCIEYIMVNIEESLSALIKEYGTLPVLFSGGVSSNTIMRRRFSEKFGAIFAEPAFSADNAFGAAVLAAIAENKL